MLNIQPLEQISRTTRLTSSRHFAQRSGYTGNVIRSGLKCSCTWDVHCAESVGGTP